MKNKYDKRRKYFMILDCETATLPFASELESAKDKQTIAIAKPLIYDLGWQIVDRNGKVYNRKSYLISEIFSVPSIFNTAYYASKRPQYIEKLENGLITLVSWKTAIAELLEDLEYVEGVGAYNSMFDFKKAIPYTEKYISNLYSNHYYEWYANEVNKCKAILEKNYNTNGNFDGNNFIFRDKKYPMFDLWGLSCEHIINTTDYKQKCYNNDWFSASGKYFKTSAEMVYRYIKDNDKFIESHTAIEDAEIETEIFAIITKKTKNKFAYGIEYFPFRILGTVEQFEIENNI